MSEKLCEVCDRERTPIGEPGCHRHASFPGQAGYLECYRLGCERLPAALAAAEERGRQELRDRLQHLASGIRKGGNDKIAEMIEIVVRNADKGEPLVKLLAAERDTAEERGRRAGIEEAAKWMRKPDADQMRFTLEQKGFFARRGPENEPDFLAAMDEVRDDLKRKGVRVNTVEMLTELYEGRGHSHEEALRMARGEPDPEDRK